MWTNKYEPIESEWYLAKVNGKKEILKWNAHNKFFADFCGKTYKFNQIDCWLDDSKTSLDAVIIRFNSDIFIDNVCLSYRHDFGLMPEQDRQGLRFECKEWMRAIRNNWEYFKNGL